MRAVETLMSASNGSRILLIEDAPALARVYVEFLRADRHDVTDVLDGRGALEAIARERFDAVVLDLKLPDIDGLALLRTLRAQTPPPPVIVITAHGSVANAVEAMRHGAYDFIVKPFNADRLNITLRNALEHKTLARMVDSYRKSLGRDCFHGFIGASAEMQAIYRTIESVAASKASVFITGESGTGKELAAEAIHKASPRRARPFVPLNCAAIPRDLLESEIFGHVRGAFTGATADRIGAATLAHGGTLFLDEICEMAPEVQVKLLRFIQTGMVQPVGASRSEKVDVRFVSATNRDPLAEVEAGRFREDLYYRLHVVPLALPPLRERDDDVILLARALLREAAAEEGKAFARLSPEAEGVLRAYDWPGNVRQLQNVLRNVVVLHDGVVVAAAMLPDPLRPSGPSAPGRPDLPASEATDPIDPPDPTGAPDALAGDRSAPTRPAIRPLWQVEKDAIQEALRQCQDDVPRAATLLEISPSTIYRKLQLWRSEPVRLRRPGGKDRPGLLSDMLEDADTRRPN